MSNRDYIAWSLAFGGMCWAIAEALGFFSKRYQWADRSWTSEGRRLRRKLDRRLERGSDRYYEELRSIQNRIKLHERSKASATTRFVVINAILAICLFLLSGFYIMNYFGHSILGVTSPRWSDAIAFWWIPIAGGQRLIESFSEDSENRTYDRVIGGLMLGAGLLVILTTFFRFSAKA